MVSAYNGRIAAANKADKKNFRIAWTNSLFTIDSWVIMKGSPNKAQAEQFPGICRRACGPEGPAPRASPMA